MKTLADIKAILASHKAELRKKYKVRQLGIFGSYATGSAQEGSDIDLLVELEEPIGLEFVTLAEELEALLGVKVDLVSLHAIQPRMLPHVKEALVYV